MHEFIFTCLKDKRILFSRLLECVSLNYCQISIIIIPFFQLYVILLRKYFFSFLLFFNFKLLFRYMYLHISYISLKSTFRYFKFLIKTVRIFCFKIPSKT